MLWLLLLCAITLVPSAQRELPPEICLICGERGTADALLNLLFFTPLGFLLARLSGLRAGLLWPVVMSIAVELMQQWIPGRNPSLGDIVFNGLGGALGALAGWTGPWLDPRRRRLPVASFGAAFGAGAAGLVATALLSAPAPPDGPYWGHWSADPGHFNHYDGRVVHAAIGEEPIPDGPLRDGARIRALVFARAPVTVEAIAGRASARLAPVLSVSDDVPRGVLLVGLEGEDVFVSYRRRAADLRLDVLRHRARGLAAGVAPGDTLRFRIDAGPDGMGIQLNGRTAHIAEPRLSRGWQLLFGAPDLPWLDVLWLLALFVPTGIFAPNRSAFAIAGATLLALLVLLPAFTWTAPTTIPALLVAVVGLIAGAAGRHSYRRIVGHGNGGRSFAGDAAQIGWSAAPVSASKK